MIIPHFIDLVCRGVSLAVLAWGVYSMGAAAAERSQVERALRARSAREDRGLHPTP